MEPAFDTDGVVLRATGLRMKYPGVEALKGVSLEAHRGEVVCVIGPNGAGKSTFLLLLGGVLLPSAGHVTVFGLHRWKQNFEIRKRSTVLPAAPLFGESESPYEFLRFYAQIYGIPKSEFLSRVRRMADEMEMTPHLDKEWKKLSLGMKKKTGLIAAFLVDADLRILDEPFAGGVDPLGMERLHEWMNAARKRGETIVFSTQVLDQAEDSADRIVLLHHGEILAQGAPMDLMEQAGVAPGEPRALAKAFLSLTRSDPWPGEA